MSSSSKHRKSDSCTSSLTPQRKHRKLLKDGSGSEVWPESIEKVFVQGLRDYWDSPWATYSQSRGRSRWRNQFLVEYLQKAGIIRSKKQVASHIQVLRNMWKGEPEFYLVSGGDEPSGDSSPFVKLEDRSLIPLEFDETDGASSSSTSPDCSPPELQRDFPPSPVHTNGSSSSHNRIHEIKEFSAAPSTQGMVYTASMPSSLTRYPIDMVSQQYHESLPIQNSHYSLGTSFYDDQIYTAVKGDARFSNRVPGPELYTTHPQSPVRPITLSLSATGMMPLTIRLDALMPSTHHAALALHVRLCITSDDDIRSSSNLDGFLGSISFSRLWVNSAKCITRVYTNNMCVSEQAGALEVSNIELGITNAMLPESPLSKCRWMDAYTALSTTITQEIVVDNETLTYIMYDIERRNSNVIPSAKLDGYQLMSAVTKPSSQADPPSFQSTGSQWQPSSATRPTPQPQPPGYQWQSASTAHPPFPYVSAPMNARHASTFSMSL